MVTTCRHYEEVTRIDVSFHIQLYVMLSFIKLPQPLYSDTNFNPLFLDIN